MNGIVAQFHKQFPFIQVTWEGTDAPMRHTVSLAGADAEADDAGVLLEPQPAAAAPASATAAQIAAADLVGFTVRSPSGPLSRRHVHRWRVRCDRRLMWSPPKLTGNFPIR
jgi:hypothetical protein